jgi:hypothetical protein
VGWSGCLCAAIRAPSHFPRGTDAALLMVASPRFSADPGAANGSPFSTLLPLSWWRWRKTGMGHEDLVWGVVCQVLRSCGKPFLFLTKWRRRAPTLCRATRTGSAEAQGRSREARARKREPCIRLWHGETRSVLSDDDGASFLAVRPTASVHAAKAECRLSAG